jgi:glycerol kinase
MPSAPSATLDLRDAMHANCGALGDTVLRVDGSMVACDWMMQRLADILGAPVDRPLHDARWRRLSAMGVSNMLAG